MKSKFILTLFSFLLIFTSTVFSQLEVNNYENKIISKDSMSLDVNIKFNNPKILINQLEEKRLLTYLNDQLDQINNIFSQMGGVINKIPDILYENNMPKLQILNKYGYTQNQFLGLVKRNNQISKISFLLSLVILIYLYINQSLNTYLKKYEQLIMLFYYILLCLILYLIFKYIGDFSFNSEFLTVQKLLELQT
jgi:hypothetical protein